MPAHARPARRSRLSRRDMLKGLAAAAVGGVAGAAAHGFMYERFGVQITRATIEMSGLSHRLQGLRVGLLTDVHRSETVPHALVESAVRVLMAEKPDLIVLGGDYVTWADRRYVGPAADALGPLSAPHGVFAILGNHDDERHVPGALRARGFAVLRDARTRLEIRGERLDLVGLRYWTRGVASLAPLLKGASENVILLAHTPARLDEAAALAVPLLLSGHTHGGQIVLPGLGALAARRFPVVAGPGRRDNTTVFVSRGVGTVYIPVRVNCPPEVAVLTLQPRAV